MQRRQESVMTCLLEQVQSSRGGVTVGDHAVIAANAVVLHDVKQGERVAGVPAKRI